MSHCGRWRLHASNLVLQGQFHITKPRSEAVADARRSARIFRARATATLAAAAASASKGSADASATAETAPDASAAAETAPHFPAQREPQRQAPECDNAAAIIRCAACTQSASNSAEGSIACRSAVCSPS
mmetsp:Transcript_8193/g.18329  ORF Transcript_8193/g.18329 Transcript_8193/m.18329 type:complete len:130 (+) Transcript_8193:206-595(+)